MSDEWNQKFKQAIANVGDSMSYNEAAATLRTVIKSNLLSLTDIQQNPRKFFEAHRLLAQKATKAGPGFFIRFTVHYNLFAGSVVAMGTDEQIDQMIQRNNIKPQLGCFGLTEVFAGVNSGLVVQTEAVLKNGVFVIDSKGGQDKNWISQGLVADECVLAATMIINGVNHGPQAFLIKMRSNGKLCDGVNVTDMGRKTVGNDLDNARLSFTNFSTPVSSLLSRYVKVDQQGNVSYPLGKVRTMDMLGQRLYSGRIAVGQAALEFTKTLFNSTRKFASNKKCWSPVGDVALITIPQVNSLFIRADKHLKMLTTFMQNLEGELCEVLINRGIPSLDLQQAIAVGKVRCLEDSIALCHALKQEVGSYALMAGTGFEQFDFLQCCKFAEGDSRYWFLTRILMQKMARDLNSSGAKTEAEKLALGKLRESLQVEMKKGATKLQAWDRSWELVYELAEVHMRGILEKVLGVPVKAKF